MEFSRLPWFIKRTIIDLVIQNHPEYRLVNREWFKRVLIEYGKVYLETSSIVNPTLSSLILRDVERIDFYRLHDIDWNTIYHYRNIKRVYILAYNEPTITETDRINYFLKEISPLSGLYLYGFNEIKFDGLNIISKHHQSLKELTMNLNSIEIDIIMKFQFKNLTSLSLINIRKPVEFNKLINLIPNLNKLNLAFDREFNYPTWLGTDLVHSILELYLCFYDDDYNPNIKLDLTKFPDITRFELTGDIELNHNQVCPLIKHLLLGGSMNYLYRTLSITFTKLESLTLFIHSGTIIEFYDLLNLCMTMNTLTRLKFSLWQVFETLDLLLPINPNSITHLSLEGDYSLSPSLLNWLTHLHLKTLDLHTCQLKNLPLLNTYTFHHLDHVILRHYDNHTIHKIFNFFNEPTRHQLNFINLIQCREGCED